MYEITVHYKGDKVVPFGPIDIFNSTWYTIDNNVLSFTDNGDDTMTHIPIANIKIFYTRFYRKEKGDKKSV